MTFRSHVALIKKLSAALHVEAKRRRKEQLSSFAFLSLHRPIAGLTECAAFYQTVCVTSSPEQDTQMYTMYQ
jgi:hypothetical protein